MNIRQEETMDYSTIYTVVKKAFDSAEHSDGNEPDLVNALRKSESYIPELSLVAEVNGQIVGHIMFTRASVGENIVLVLAPLSVLPEYQKNGFGTALMKEGHRIAKELGYGYSVVLGSEKYYPRAVYVPADTLGIFSPFDIPRENFMAYKIENSFPEISGTIKYPKEFGVD